MGRGDGGQMARYVMLAVVLLVGTAAATTNECAKIEMTVPVGSDAVHMGACRQAPADYSFVDLTATSTASTAFRIMWGDMPCGDAKDTASFVEKGSRTFSDSLGAQTVTAMGPFSSARAEYAPAVMVSCRDAAAPCVLSLNVCTRTMSVASDGDDDHHEEEPEMISMETLIWILAIEGTFVVIIITIGGYLMIKMSSNDPQAFDAERSGLLKAAPHHHH